MALIEDVDLTRPLTISGFYFAEVTNPTILNLADELNMPRMKVIAEPVDGASLSFNPPDVFTIMEWLKTTKWLAYLEKDLQCMAEDMDGNNLLTSWLTMEEFARFAENCSHIAPLRILSELRFRWAGRGVTEVYFDWYEKEGL